MSGRDKLNAQPDEDPALNTRIAELEAEQQAAITAGTISAWERTPACAELDRLRDERGYRPGTAG